MTAINFPSDPQVGDTFLNFAWDGEKWRNAGSRASAVVLKDLFEFSVAADDSTLRTVSTGESIKFTGAGTVTTSSDAEGNITITGSGGSGSTLVNGAYTVSLGSDGNLTLPPGGNILNSSGQPYVYGLTSISSSVSTGLYSDASGDYTYGTLNYSYAVNGNAGQFSIEYSRPLVSGNVDINVGNTIVNGDLTLSGDIRSEGNINIDINLADSTLRRWQFGEDGALTLPPGGSILDSSGQPYVNGVSSINTSVSTSIFTDASGDYQYGTLSYDYAVNGVSNSFSIEYSRPLVGGNVDINVGSVVVNGNLTFPDNSIQTTAWTGVADYNNLINKPSLAGTYTFNVAADDSTLRTIGSEETIKFVGAGGITTASDAEGAITITQGAAAAGTLTGDTLNSTVVTSSLTSVGTLTGLTVGGTGGDLTMTGGAITGVGNITAAGILAVNASGGITTNQTAFDIVNSTATTVNLGGAATAVNIGAITGTLTVNNPTVVGTQTTATLFNTTATTVSAFGAATTLTIGATSGTLTLRNTTIVGTQSSLTLFNTVASTVNTFGAATTLNIGYTGTTGSNTTNILTAAQQTGTTKTINIATGSAVGSTTAVNIGSTSGTSTVTVNGTLVGSATSQDVFNTTATTVNFAGAATTLNIGASTGNTTVNNNLKVAGNINTGSNSFAKSPGAGDIAMDNNSTDTPGLLMYYAANSNFGIDSWNGTFDILSGQLFRVTNKLNETGGAVKVAIDTTGNAVFTGFVQANAWRAGQVIKETVLGHTDVTQTQQGGVNRFATDSYNREFIRYAYTPSSSSSYIVVTMTLAKYSAYQGTGNDSYFSQMQVGATSGYSRNANGEPQGLSEVAYSLLSTVNGNRTGTLFPLMGRYTNGDTNSKTISIAVRRESADDYWDYDWSASSFCMRITEIAR